MTKTPSGHRKTKRTINAIGHAHELTFSCHERRPLLTKDRTRNWLVQSIELARHRWNFALWAWVIMPEHVHLLIRPRDHEYDMARILKAIKQPVAQKGMAYLKLHAPEAAEQFRITRPDGRIEHRFWQQGGGYDRNIFDPGMQEQPSSIFMPIRFAGIWFQIHSIGDGRVLAGMLVMLMRS